MMVHINTLILIGVIVGLTSGLTQVVLGTAILVPVRLLQRWRAKRAVTRLKLRLNQAYGKMSKAPYTETE